jgi:methylthioribose-1-phosphate isomerase
MQQGRIDAVITGADRIAANGDCANKIGTYGAAVLADVHGIPFYVAAPGSTVDLECPSGSDIVIEERDPGEMRNCGGQPTAPRTAPVYNPAFDVTPARYVRAILTENGVLRPPFADSLSAFEVS